MKRQVPEAFVEELCHSEDIVFVHGPEFRQRQFLRNSVEFLDHREGLSLLKG